ARSCRARRSRSLVVASVLLPQGDRPTRTQFDRLLGGRRQLFPRVLNQDDGRAHLIGLKQLPVKVGTLSRPAAFAAIDHELQLIVLHCLTRAGVVGTQTRPCWPSAG